MRRKERVRCDVTGWLHRNRERFPDGFTAEAITQLADWERARYEGKLVLKKPQERMVVQMPEKDRRVFRALGVHDFSKVTVYVKQIGEPSGFRWSDDNWDRVPSRLRRGRASVAMTLRQLAASGILEVEPGSKPRHYRMPTKRLVFAEPAP